MSASTDYNPCADQDGNAAKIWELLRRNDVFREFAGQLLGGYQQSQDPRCLTADFREIDPNNPIAGFVLRWLFKPACLTDL
jgi:hypothetical protein